MVRDELARALWHRQAVAPLLRRGASLGVDTSAPNAQVIDTSLAHVRP